MPEILLRVVDKINDSDFYLNCQCTKRGDVIVAKPDGWAWGVEELSNPDWRIVKFPIANKVNHDLMLAELGAMLTPERDIDPTRPSRTLQRRAFHLDLAHVSIPPALRAFLLDGSRNASVFVVTALPAALRALVSGIKVVRPPISDPAIIGSGSPAIIG